MGGFRTLGGTSSGEGATANRICFGADTADANITLITVDNGVVATKTPLTTPITKLSMITGDPNTNGPCVFEAILWALPNNANVHAKLVNKSTGVVLHDADIGLTLPLNTTTLRPTCVSSSKAAVAAGTVQDFIHFWAYY